mgnify:CR=1 FL=1
MFFQKFRVAKIFICVLLAIACLPIAGCLHAEAHREFPTEEETTEENKPVDTRPRVALTFDDGPHEKYQETPSRTKLIVDELDKYGYHATFFVVGNRVDGTKYPGGAAMVYAAEHGNEIGIHGYTHAKGLYYDNCSDEKYEEEMRKTLEAIQEKLPDYEVRLMRPVGGRITNARIEESPYAIIKWNVDTLDWELDEPYGDAEAIETIANNALKNVKDGDIILMHDIYNNTYEATVIILQRLNEMGFNVVTVSELLGDNLQAGVLYEKAP